MSFEQDMKRFEQKVAGACEKTIRATGLQMFSAIIEKTPVGNPDNWKSPAPPGYIGGTARGNWQTAIGTIPSTELPLRDEAAAKAEINLAVAQFTLADVMYFSNPVPYIQRLEEGWSGQAPHGMVETTVSDFRQAIDDNARKHRI